MEMNDFTKTLAGIRSKQKGKKAPKKAPGLGRILTKAQQKKIARDEGDHEYRSMGQF